MEKAKRLEQIRLALAMGEVTKEEVLAIVERNDNGIIKRPGVVKRKFNLANVMYYIGGGIVAIGIAVLIGQNWHALNSYTRILATFGVAIAAYIVAIILHTKSVAKQA